MDRLASAFALTVGREHTLAYANTAFRNLRHRIAEIRLGACVTDIMASRDSAAFLAILDRAYRSGLPARNCPIDSGGSDFPISCSIWPSVNSAGGTEHMLVELRPSTGAEIGLSLQRQVAERLLVSVLREQRAAERAEELSRSATYLARESRRLGKSLDETETIGAIKRTRLPYLGAWCIVDILAEDHTMHRLAVIHPEPEKQALLATLEGRWTPAIGDAFGLPAALKSTATTAIAANLETAFAESPQPRDIVAALRALGAGPSLTVPLIVGEHLMGALTFVADRLGTPYSPADVELAQELADRSAAALERARLYADAIAHRIHAESANQAKSTFLGMMSHELRTPLNAIGGYVDLIDMELHGPVTEAQHTDLARIRTNQKYLTGLINDLLSLTKVDGGQMIYNIRDIDVTEVLEASRAVVAPLILQRLMEYDDTSVERDVVARADRDKVVQILVNLLSNALKFTQPGGRIQVGCTASDKNVTILVCDTGIGIPSEKLEEIFSPFMQLNGGSLAAQAGVGLGLAISRGLARAMHGDLIAQSTPGNGACLTLTLPRAIPGRIPPSAEDTP